VLYPGRGLCGDILVADIGIPAAVLEHIVPNAWENGPDLWLEGYPWPQQAITGASRMTAQAASRGGAGMVTLAAPAKAWSIYATSLTNAIVHSFDGLSDFETLLADSRRNVIAIGPGAAGRRRPAPRG
jgi:NAD(P)H-hydrate epimerase